MVGVGHAGLQEPVRGCITAAVALQRFDEYDGWSDRWPETVISKGANEGECPRGVFGKTADPSAVDDQHGPASLVELTIADASHDRVARLLTSCRSADFCGQFGEVVGGRFEHVAAFEFGAYGHLEEFGGGQIAALQFVVEVVWEVHLAQPLLSSDHC